MQNSNDDVCMCVCMHSEFACVHLKNMFVHMIVCFFITCVPLRVCVCVCVCVQLQHNKTDICNINQ